MKELLKPWNNWQSEDATIAGENVAEAVANDPFFRNQVINGGQALERAVKNGARNHYRQWLNSHIQDNGDTIQLNDVNEMLRHLTTNTTLNFESSLTQSDINKTDSANRQEISRIPNNLFLWDSALKQRPLGLSYRMPNLKIQRANYDAYLTQHQFKLVQTESSLPDNSNPLYQVNGSTHFSFFVPVPSFEDEFMTKSEAIESFYRQVALTKTMPFVQRNLNCETIAAIQELDSKDSLTTYNNFAELRQNLGLQIDQKY